MNKGKTGFFEQGGTKKAPVMSSSFFNRWYSFDRNHYQPPLHASIEVWWAKLRTTFEKNFSLYYSYQYAMPRYIAGYEANATKEAR